MTKLASLRWAAAVPAHTVMCLIALQAMAAESEKGQVQVHLDISETPHLRAWGEQAQQQVRQWHPRICNLLPSQDHVPPSGIVLRIEKSDRGIASTSGAHMRVSSHWIEKHPEDMGLVIHELAHVVQGYRSPEPLWVTEGIADYIRWAIYEAKPLGWFPVDRREQGYLASYQVAAGFLLWLEGDRWPGAVNALNRAMRNQSYDQSLFRQAAGKPLDELWTEYLEARQAQADDEAN